VKLQTVASLTSIIDDTSYGQDQDQGPVLQNIRSVFDEASETDWLARKTH
jgi:hypothetical protein